MLGVESIGCWIFCARFYGVHHTNLSARHRVFLQLILIIKPDIKNILVDKITKENYPVSHVLIAVNESLPIVRW